VTNFLPLSVMNFERAQGLGTKTKVSIPYMKVIQHSGVRNSISMPVHIAVQYTIHKMTCGIFLQR